jgi:hypothetical protein
MLLVTFSPVMVVRVECVQDQLGVGFGAKQQVETGQHACEQG